VLSSFHLNASHFRISSTDSNVRTTLYSIINSTTGKYCSVALFECSHFTCTNSKVRTTVVHHNRRTVAKIAGDIFSPFYADLKYRNIKQLWQSSRGTRNVWKTIVSWDWQHMSPFSGIRESELFSRVSEGDSWKLGVLTFPLCWLPCSRVASGRVFWTYGN